jgi:hypothetical protein
VKRDAYDRDARRRIEAGLRAGETPHCPACGGELRVTRVAAPRGVPYVRRRVLVVCAGCGRTASFDAQR